MVIEFLKPAHNLGYSYKAGARAASLPLNEAKKLVALGVAREIEVEKPKQAVVKTATVKKTTKAVVKDKDK